jgi:hypothetical protein
MVRHVENIQVDLLVLKAFFYTKKERKTTNYLSITANCRYCITPCKYKFELEDDPFILNNDLVYFKVTRTNKHNHSNEPIRQPSYKHAKNKKDDQKYNNGCAAAYAPREPSAATAAAINKAITNDKPNLTLSEINGGSSSSSSLNDRIRNVEYNEANINKVNTKEDLLLDNLNQFFNKIKDHIDSSNKQYSPDFFVNIHTAKSLTDKLINGKHLSGCIRYFTSIPAFTLHLYMEKQFESINTTPIEDRFLHINSTGNLVEIDKRYSKNLSCHYNKTLNYIMILSSITTQNSSQIGELITSQHDVISINTFICNYRHHYESCYPNDLFKFRLISVDYSWPTIHACLKAFNNESAIQYSNRIFAIVDSQTSNDTDKSSLVSSVIDTMKHFSQSIKQFSTNPAIHSFTMLAFSLLLNSKNLMTLKNVYRIIIVIFLSKKTNTMYKNAFRLITEAINNREEKKVYDKFIEEETPRFVSLLPEPIENEYNNEDETDQLLKESSPFYKIFVNVLSEIKQQLYELNEDDDNIHENNVYYNIQVVDHLTQKYMPYCFIWSSLVLNDLATSRLTNELSGNYNSFQRYNSKNLYPNLLPHAYVNETFKNVLDSNVKYINQRNKAQSIHKKVTKQVEQVENVYEIVDQYSKNSESDISFSFQNSADIIQLLSSQSSL